MSKVYPLEQSGYTLDINSVIIILCAQSLSALCLWVKFGHSLSTNWAKISNIVCSKGPKRVLSGTILAQFEHNGMKFSNSVQKVCIWIQFGHKLDTNAPMGTLLARNYQFLKSELCPKSAQTVAQVCPWAKHFADFCIILSVL